VRALGRVGGKTLSYFLVTTLAGAIIGITVAMVARVGEGLSPTTVRRSPDNSGRRLAVLRRRRHRPSRRSSEHDPAESFASAAQGGGDLLPLIIAVCIFAAAATVIDAERRRAVVEFFDAVNAMAMVVIGWLMRLAPFAVFVLIAATVARSGWSLLDQLLTFALVVIAALALHVALVLLPALIVGARLRIASFFRSVSDAILVAFSTASSNATLPVSMTAARDRLGIPSDIVSFVLPPGASLNKNGSAVYKAVTAVFIAHLYGVPLAAA
jgi:DAACS family dicarboxylate/amino acid:cation (Na+ or H+) symporter